MAPDAILFDWDGTLLDSAEATYRCYCRVFGRFGVPFDRDSFERTYCPDWYRTYELVGLPRGCWDEADGLWQRFFKEEPPGLLPQTRDALGRLRAAEVRLGVVTSGEKTRVAADLARHALSDCFDTVVCAGDTPERKPHPAPLRLALEQIGVAPDRAAYVGDSPEDVQMARAAGVHAVAIPGGFPNRAALLASGPNAVAPTLNEALAGLLAR
jgi:HAD superfamily hydrolase (TIGR01509 family)